jgi:hypothetical protein
VSLFLAVIGWLIGLIGLYAGAVLHATALAGQAWASAAFFMAWAAYVRIGESR